MPVACFCAGQFVVSALSATIQQTEGQCWMQRRGRLAVAKTNRPCSYLNKGVTRCNSHWTTTVVSASGSPGSSAHLLGHQTNPTVQRPVPIHLNAWLPGVCLYVCLSVLPFTGVKSIKYVGARATRTCVLRVLEVQTDQLCVFALFFFGHWWHWTDMWVYELSVLHDTNRGFF